MLMCGEPESLVTKARRRVDQDSREFNVALWRVAVGKPGPGGIPAELATITGIDPEAIRSRVAHCARDYPPPPIPVGCYDSPDDIDYRGAILRGMGDPEAREFLQGISGSQRRSPDHEEPRVARQRINGRMVSIARDLPRS